MKKPNLMSKISTRDAGVLGALNTPLIFGLLRLGIKDRIGEDAAVALIHKALDGGIRVLDAADSYCLDQNEFHYGERLAKRAVENWRGPRGEVRIITKVGMVRPKGKWKPNGSPDHIAKAVDGSLKALGVERLFLLQLHARDPGVPFEETLGALGHLRRAGKVEHIGLCNVRPAEIRQALRHFPVASVQNELSVIAQASAKEGLLEFTRELGIPFLAYRPLGGYAKVDKLLKNRVLKSLAEKRGVSPHDIALAAVLRSAPHVIPVLGATRAESLEKSFRALGLSLEENEWEQIVAKYPFRGTDEALAANAPRRTPSHLPKLVPGEGPGRQPEVVMLMGIQGAGKSEATRAYQAAGYARLNRDEEGGSLDDLLPRLRALLENGQERVVLDNTYPTRISREPVITMAHAHAVPVRCRWLTTSMEDARINVSTRMLDRYGKLLGPEERKELTKSDPNLPPPAALQRYMSSFEPPRLDEGFSAIDEIPFRRRPNLEHTNRALLLDADGTLRETFSGELYPRSAGDVKILPGRTEVLRRWVEAGFKLFLVSNQSGIASGKLSEEAARAAFERTRELLGVPIEEVAYCPHRAFPVVCFCRKPMPGMGVYLMRKHKLDPGKTLMVGDMESDRKFSQGLAIAYYDAREFFVDGLKPPKL